MKRIINYLLLGGYLFFFFLSPIQAEEEYKKLNDYTNYQEILENGLNVYETIEGIMDGYEILQEKEEIFLPKTFKEESIHLFQILDIQKKYVIEKPYTVIENTCKIQGEKGIYLFVKLKEEEHPKDLLPVNTSLTKEYHSSSTYEVKYPGIYQLEIWGKEGEAYTQSDLRKLLGGKGSYSKGEIELKEGDSLTISFLEDETTIQYKNQLLIQALRGTNATQYERGKDGKGNIASILKNTKNEEGVHTGEAIVRITYLDGKRMKIRYLDASNGLEIQPPTETIYPLHNPYNIQVPSISSYLFYESKPKELVGIIEEDLEIVLSYLPIPKPELISSKANEILKVNEDIQYTISFYNPFSETKNFNISIPIPEGIQVKSIYEEGKIQENAIHWEESLPSLSSKTVSYIGSVNGKEELIQSIASLSIEGIEVQSNPIQNNIGFEASMKVMDSNGNDLHDQAISKDTILTYQINLQNPFQSTKHFFLQHILPAHCTVLAISEGGIQKEDGIYYEMDLPPNTTEVLEVKVQPQIESSYTSYANIAMHSYTMSTNTVESWILKPPSLQMFNEAWEPIDGSTLLSGTIDSIHYLITMENPSSKDLSYTIQTPLSKQEEVIESSLQGEIIEGNMVWNLLIPKKESIQISFTTKVSPNYAGVLLRQVTDTQEELFSNQTQLTIQKPQEYITYRGSIVWNDEDNKDLIRPNKVKVRLLENGNVVYEKTIIKNEDGEMVFQFDPVLKKETATYEVDYLVPNGYQASLKEVSPYVYKIVSTHKVGTSKTEVGEIKKIEKLQSIPNTNDTFSLKEYIHLFLLSFAFGILLKKKLSENRNL